MKIIVQDSSVVFFKKLFNVVLTLSELVLCISLKIMVIITWNILISRVSLFVPHWISEFYAFVLQRKS